MRRFTDDSARHLSPWMAIDAVLWIAMLILAVWIRFDFSVRQFTISIESARFYWIMAGLIGASTVLGWLMGLYRGRYVPGSLIEFIVLTLVFGTATALAFLGHVASGAVENVPRSTPIIAGVFTILGALVLRSYARRKELFGAGRTESKEPALIFGAGDGGLQLVRQLRRSPVSQFNPVGILDDDPSKRHMLIDGVRVFGDRERLGELARKTGAGTLIVAVPSLPGDELINVRDSAESLGLHVLVLPSLDSMMRGRVAANELREINVNDLLGRRPAHLNQTQIADYIRAKRVLVTGAGGSIGSELCRQVSRFRPAELIMLDRDESGLHSVQLSLQDQAMLDGDDTVLMSIRDRASLAKLFDERKPQIVFHAAALKHMPLLENYPIEAIKTNVLGTRNLLEAAANHGVETFVNISTDKAANPTSALGTSKRVAEKLTAQTAQEVPTGKFVSVRFGNVLGSRGSVLTVFEKQIRAGGPVTVTDPEVTRYFMTIPEACQLVLQAAAVGDTGDTIVLDMGEPIKIAEVARTLIEQSGQDIDIVFTGLREKEKLAEELFDDSENPSKQAEHEALSVVRVGPLSVDLIEIDKIDSDKAAIDWLNRNAVD